MNLEDKIKAAKDKAKKSKKKRVVTKTKQPKGKSKHIVRKSGKTVDVYKGDDGVKTRVVTDVDGNQKGKTKYPGGKQKWTSTPDGGIVTTKEKEKKKKY